MTERPILFSTEMVKAILDGRKTQTRRVIKPQPKLEHNFWMYKGDVFLSDSIMQDHLFHNVYGVNGSPYGSVYADGTSDTLWVRETWQAQTLAGDWWHEIPKEKRELYNWAVIDRATWAGAPPPKWIPSIFMPRWASRMTLQVENVRVERVQEISEYDAEAEGLLPTGSFALGESLSESAIVRFSQLWDSINARRGYGWEANPWVWVLEFKEA